MSLQRVRATALARLLNSVERPVYVLDDEGAIVFCNQALLSAIGPAAVDLPGRRCLYHDGRELVGADATAAGLCPPPSAMAGQTTTGSVSWTGEDGQLHTRWARFIPVCDSACSSNDSGKSESTEEIEDVIAVIALVEAEDLPEGEADESGPAETRPAVAEAAQLHRRLSKFRHSAAARYRIDQLIGDTPAMRKARRQVELAAASRVGVLLVGRPGTGRRHIANTIHYASRDTLGGAAVEGSLENSRANGGSLVPLDCSVLGADLIRSTIAAMPGGSVDESTQPDTLLLNEADKLPVEVQAELAAMISRPNFTARLIATSHQPLDELAAEGSFHEGLAAVLSTIVIELPPLARRRADLPLLAQMFVERENARGEKQVGGLTTEALDMLDGYDWPGNIDELARVIAESHASAQSTMIAAGDLPKTIHLAAGAAARPRRPEETIVLDEFLAHVERELLQRAMRRSKGNKAKAARMLGLTRPRLYRRLIQLGLEQPPIKQEETVKQEETEQIDFQEDDE